MNNQVVMDKFFKLLKEELQPIDILNKPEHIFNAEETGIDLNARSGKVIVCKSTKRSYHFYGLLFSFWTSLAINDQIKKKLESGPYSGNGSDGFLYGKSPNGYMDEELFLT